MNRSHREPLPPSTLDALVSSAAVLEEVADLRREFAMLRDERANSVDETPFGPCTYCGVASGYAVNDHWETNTLCSECYRDQPLPDESGTFTTARREYWRHEIFRRLLGPDGKPVADARECGVLFFDELSSRQRQGDTRRWAHIDEGTVRRKNILVLKAQELEARMQEGARYLDGDPCPRCGCAHMFIAVPAQDGREEHLTFTGSDGSMARVLRNVSEQPAGVKCGGCSHLPTKIRDGGGASDLGEVFAEILGLYRLDERVVDLGVRWYSDLPAKSPARKLTQAPFQYLGDLWEMRCNIFRETAPLEYMWRSHGLWEQLNADPRSHTRPAEAS